jgi:hypothetical protein
MVKKDLRSPQPSEQSVGVPSHMLGLDRGEAVGTKAND